MCVSENVWQKAYDQGFLLKKNNNKKHGPISVPPEQIVRLSVVERDGSAVTSAVLQTAAVSPAARGAWGLQCFGGARSIISLWYISQANLNEWFLISVVEAWLHG